MQMDDSNKLFIEPTSKTLKVDLDKQTGKFVFSGRCLPEGTCSLYSP